jgi:hypothetical protein
MKNLKCNTIHASRLGKYVAKKNKLLAKNWDEPKTLGYDHIQFDGSGNREKKRLGTNTGFGPELFGSNLT